MPHIVEPTMQESLWKWLDQRGYTVHGEVSVGKSGIIDLVAYDPGKDVFTGIELKDATEAVDETVTKEAPIVGRSDQKEISNPKREAYVRPWPQLAKYLASGYFNEIYFASQAPDAAFQNEDREEVCTLFDDCDQNPEDVGGIRISDPVTDDPTISITRDATSQPRDQTLSLSSTTEPWVIHHVWRELGGIREAVIPNQQTRTMRRIDIMSFPETQDPTTVYYEQPDERIIAIEAKGAEAVRSSPQKVSEQLADYVQSGAATDLYLAAPAVVEAEALDLIHNAGLDSVGLYTVDEEGVIAEIKPSSFVPLRYDGLRTKHGTYVDIGWGRFSGQTEKSPNEYASVFDLGQSL